MCEKIKWIDLIWVTCHHGNGFLEWCPSAFSQCSIVARQQEAEHVTRCWTVSEKVNWIYVSRKLNQSLITCSKQKIVVNLNDPRTSYSLESPEEWCENYAFLHHANVFSLLRTLFYGIKVALWKHGQSWEFIPGIQDRLHLINYPIPCNGYIFQRLIGELIGWPWSGVRPVSVVHPSVVHNFKERSSSLKPLGLLFSYNIYSIYR